MHLVLVVEDEYGNAEVLQLLLEAEGYRVAVASNGRVALELLAGEKPAVILSDFMMPHLTGGELGTAVRANPKLADVPFVILSATSEHVVQATFADYDAFVEKPYAAEALLELVAHLIANGRPRRDVEAAAEASVKRLLRGLMLPPA